MTGGKEKKKRERRGSLRLRGDQVLGNSVLVASRVGKKKGRTSPSLVITRKGMVGWPLVLAKRGCGEKARMMYSERKGRINRRKKKEGEGEEDSTLPILEKNSLNYGGPLFRCKKDSVLPHYLKNQGQERGEGGALDHVIETESSTGRDILKNCAEKKYHLKRGGGRKMSWQTSI